MSTDQKPARSLVAKLAEVMKLVGVIEKKGYNEKFQYAFARESDVLEALRTLLADRNVVLIPGITAHQHEEISKSDRGTVTRLTTVSQTFTFFDGDSGEEITREWRGAGTDTQDKGVYKAITGGEKYFLLKSFLIPTGDDPENDDAAGDQRRGRQQQRPPQRQAPPPQRQPQAARPPQTNAAPATAPKATAPPATAPAASQAPAATARAATAPATPAAPTQPAATSGAEITIGEDADIAIKDCIAHEVGAVKWIEIVLSTGESVIATAPSVVNNAAGFKHSGKPVVIKTKVNAKGKVVVEKITPKRKQA